MRKDMDNKATVHRIATKTGASRRVVASGRLTIHKPKDKE